MAYTLTAGTALDLWDAQLGCEFPLVVSSMHGSVEEYVSTILAQIDCPPDVVETITAAKEMSVDLSADISAFSPSELDEIRTTTRAAIAGVRQVLSSSKS